MHDNDRAFLAIQAAILGITLILMAFMAQQIGQLTASINAQITTDELMLKKIEALDAKYHQRTLELKGETHEPRND